MGARVCPWLIARCPLLDMGKGKTGWTINRYGKGMQEKGGKKISYEWDKGMKNKCKVNIIM